MQLLWIILIVFSIWLVILTIFFWNLYNHYNKILRGSTQKSLQGFLEALLKEKELTKQDIENLKLRCATIERESKIHIQKIGLLRFNPFKETGGDQSFILALVDGEDSGVVISGLYSRSGTRWYAKRVIRGKGEDYKLSEDEEKALRQTKRIVNKQ